MYIDLYEYFAYERRRFKSRVRIMGTITDQLYELSATLRPFFESEAWWGSDPRYDVSYLNDHLHIMEDRYCSKI